MARVHLTDDAKEDLRDLDRSAQVLIVKALRKLEVEPEKRGQPLGSQSTSDLTGLRKLVVGDRDYRIVFQVHPDGSVCVIWVIGRRADNEVYEIARARLSTFSDVSHAKALAKMLDESFEIRPVSVERI